MKNVHIALFLASVLVIAGSGCSKMAPEATPDTKAADAAPPAEAASAPNLARNTPDAGQVEHVPVSASGRGPTVAAAVDQALKLAIQQVNGKTMDMSAFQFQGGMAVAVGEDRVDIGSSAFAEFIATRSRGAVTGFRLLSQTDLENGDVEVSIEAKVAKFARPESAGILRVAVMPFRASGDAFVVDTERVPAIDVVQSIRGSMVNALVQSKRVTVLDREYSEEVGSELAQLETGLMSTDEFARLGERLMTDYIVVGRIERFGYERQERQLRNSDRTVVSHSGGAQLSLRVINTTTGQIELSDTVSIELPETAPTTLGSAVNASQVTGNLATELASEAADAVIMRLFPLTVVAVDGGDVVLSQGGSTVFVGDVYDVVLRGAEITDPQTGRVIGRMEKQCCVIEVTRVTPDLSYGKVVQSEVDIGSVFAPGALEVSGAARRPAKTASVATGDSTVKTNPPTALAKSPKATPPTPQPDPNW